MALTPPPSAHLCRAREVVRENGLRPLTPTQTFVVNPVLSTVPVVLRNGGLNATTRETTIRSTIEGLQAMGFTKEALFPSPNPPLPPRPPRPPPTAPYSAPRVLGKRAHKIVIVETQPSVSYPSSIDEPLVAARVVAPDKSSFRLGEEFELGGQGLHFVQGVERHEKHLTVIKIANARAANNPSLKYLALPHSRIINALSLFERVRLVWQYLWLEETIRFHGMLWSVSPYLYNDDIV